jgi:multicomponent Na+:H+ antiporter subunit D
MNILMVLPILIPLLTGATGMLAWRYQRLQRMISVVGAAALLVAAIVLLSEVWSNGIQVMQGGNWPAPFGITLVADLFSSVMVLLAGTTGLAVVLYSLVSIDRRREAFGFHPLVHVLLMGVCGAFLTGDIFNLYVWFEVLLIASFVLLALGGERAQMEGAIKYVTLNLISSAIFLAAVGILYGEAGTLNMADISVRLAESPREGLTTALAMLFLIAFGIKAAIFPLFFWLPASYHTPPVVISTLFAALLTKVGVYSLIRVFTLIFTQDTSFTHTLILVIAGLTMVAGVLGAIAQIDFRRLLSFLIICEIGFLLMGLGIFTPLALAGSVFFMIHAVISMSALFLMSGVTERIFKTFNIRNMGGLYQSYPVLSVLFLIPALGLAGLPPMAGFFAKVTLLQAAIEAESYTIVIVALVVSLLVLIAIAKIWVEAFWKNPPDAAAQRLANPNAMHARGRWLAILFAPIVTLAALTLLLGLASEAVLAIAVGAGEQLMNPDGYINAVLGGQP